MKKALLFMLLLSAIVISTYAVQDSIMIADYEPNSVCISSTSSWTESDISVVVNPESEAINSSDSVLKFTRTTQWSSAIEFTDFGNVSLFQRSIIKLKVRSDSTVSKVIQIMITDVNDYTTSVQGTMSDQDSTWEDIAIDFTDKLKTTPISFINKIVIQIDYGQPVSAGATKNIYYIDDIRFAGEPADVTENDTLVMHEETFGGNAWWDGLNGDPDGTGAYYGTLAELRTIAWGGSALTGAAEHYIGSDSLKYVRLDWSGNNNAAVLYPSSIRHGISDLELVGFDIAGKGNLTFMYDLQWITAPTAYTHAPAIEYQLAGGSWTALTTSSTLPSGTGSWSTGLTYPLTGVSGDTVNLRITNSTTGRCYIDNLSFIGTLVFADSLKIFASSDSIKVNNGTIQLTDTVYPLNANQTVEWSIVGGTGKAELVSTLPSIVKGKANGTVLVRARALDVWGEVSDTVTIYMINQNPVDSIAVLADANFITMDNGTLQMRAELFPFDSTSAFDSSITWSTNSTIAIINDTGLVTAVGNGVVVITATANDGSGVYGTDTITISNQWANFAVANKIDSTNIANDVDYSANIDMMWDDSTMYVTLTIIDEKIFNDGGDVWVVDNTEIYFDMNNEKVVSWPRTLGWPPAYENGINDYYQLRVMPDSSWSSLNNLGGVDLTFNVDTTTGGDTVGYTYKLVFALDSLQEDFAPLVGKKIGFDILTSDNDGDPDYRDQLSLNSPSGLIYVDPSLWGSLQFDAGGIFSIIPDETAPSKPNITATVTKSDVAVTWEASTDNIAVFEYIILEGGIPIDTVSAAQENNGFTIGGLANGSYSYSVIAVDNYGNMSDTSDVAQVTVNHIAVTGLTIGGGTSIDTKGGTLQMTVTVTPDDATDKSVTWSIDDESVATIDATTGLLTAVSNGTVLVKATSNDNIYISDLVEVAISNQTGIYESVAAKFTVYPNPANNILYITSEKIIESVTITNIIGEVVIQNKLNSTNAGLNVEELNSGAYFITVESGGAFSTGIFIVK